MPAVAMKERVSWAELSPEVFQLVPSIEDFHYCKPQLGFYGEIAQKLGLEPWECLMVGNDLAEDMVASRVGMKTFWVGERTEQDAEIKPDYQGGLADLQELILQGTL